MGAFRHSAANFWRDLLDRMPSTDLRSWVYSAGCLGLGVAAIGGTLLALDLSLDQSVLKISPRTPGERIESASAKAARLPRSRPDERLTTGSIRSASISPPVDQGYSNEIATRAARVAALQDKAILIATTRTECDGVTGSEVANGVGEPGNHFTVLIRCNNGTRFYLNEVAIERSHLPVFEDGAGKDLSEASALKICEQHVRVGLPFPGSLRRDPLSTITHRDRDGSPVVKFEFNTVNGFGFPLAFRVQCIFSGQEIARLELTPR